MSLRGMYGTNPGETLTLKDPSKGLWGGYTVTTTKKPVQYAAPANQEGGSGGGQNSGGGLTDAAKSAYGKAIDQYAPGGGYMKGIEAGIKRGGTRAVASGMQGLVSAGLSNTTQAGGLGKKYEEEVGAPIRAQAESQRVQGLASLYAALGGAEQGAFEGSAGRGLGYAQINANQATSAGQLGFGYAQLSADQNLGYAQLGASQSASAGQLGLGYAQLGASQKASEAEMQLRYAQLNAKANGGDYQSLLPSKSYFS